jgi:alkylation response protein AidB-like acyl-CoA dehydrogenase
MLPEEHGGTGQGMAALCEILCALAKADASFAAVLFINAMGQSALLKWGQKEIIDKHVSSELIAFPAYDLPSDLPRTARAEKEGDGYSLSGKVEYLPLAPVAQALIVPAETGDQDRLGFFIIDAMANGVAIGEPVLSLGLRNCPAADIELSGAKVSGDALLCSDAGADYPALAALFRTAAAALAVGVCEGSFEAAKAYAKDRYQGGTMIINYDQIRLMLSNLAVVAESGKALVKSMALAADDQRPWPISDAGLIFLTEQASRATTDGVQILGGYGYMEDYGQEKRMRDAKQIESIFGAAPAKRLDLIADILRQEE